MNYYKILDLDARSCNGGDLQWHTPRGKRPGNWMPRIDNLVPCESGYHICRPRDISQWLGPDRSIWRVEPKGDMIALNDKVVVSQCRLLSRCSWDDSVARLFACMSSYDAAPLA